MSSEIGPDPATSTPARGPRPRALPDRILMGPGPSNCYPEVTAALGYPIVGHLDPEFLECLDDTGNRLRCAFQTTNLLTFPLSGTGSAGMEASFVNLVEPGDQVVVGVNGLFGERMCEVAHRAGAVVTRVDAPWGVPIDPERLLDAHPSPKVIALVHAETSTGVRNEIGDLARGKGDALLLVDAVTSLGGIEVAADSWGVDIAYSGTQKCLGVPPGLAPLTLSARAQERLVPRCQSWYLDLRLIAGYVESGTRVYHHTAPVTMVRALHAGLGVLIDEGLEATWARHAACGRLLQDGLEALGFTLFAPEGHRLPELTTVWVPERGFPSGLDEPEVRERLLRLYSIEIGNGVGEFAGRVWRIGCMGHTARERNVIMLLQALEELTGMGAA